MGGKLLDILNNRASFIVDKILGQLEAMISLMNKCLDISDTEELYRCATELYSNARVLHTWSDMLVSELERFVIVSFYEAKRKMQEVRGSGKTG